MQALVRPATSGNTDFELWQTLGMRAGSKAGGASAHLPRASSHCWACPGIEWHCPCSVGYQPLCQRSPGRSGTPPTEAPVMPQSCRTTDLPRRVQADLTAAWAKAGDNTALQLLFRTSIRKLAESIATAHAQNRINIAADTNLPKPSTTLLASAPAAAPAPRPSARLVRPLATEAEQLDTTLMARLQTRMK